MLSPTVMLLIPNKEQRREGKGKSKGEGSSRPRPRVAPAPGRFMGAGLHQLISSPQSLAWVRPPAHSRGSANVC